MGNSRAVVPQDDDWLTALRGGDAAQVETVVRSLQALLRGSLAKGFGRQLSEEDLDELAQASVTRVVEKLPSFEGRSKLSTWAVSIAVNLALGELRKRKHAALSWEEVQQRGSFAEEMGASPDVPDRSLDRRARDRVLAEAVAAVLSKRQQEALSAVLGGMEVMEVSRRMGTNRGALYKLLHDARRRLSEHFKEQGWEARDLLLGEGEEQWSVEVAR